MMKWNLFVAVVCGLLLSEATSAGCRPPTRCIENQQCTNTHINANSNLLSTILIFPCDLARNKKGVCCPELPSPTRLGTELHKNKKLLPEEYCGRAFTEKITNGKNASMGQFPWMALIGVRTKNDATVRYICGGSIINKRYVLTAAHCANSTGSTLVSVRLGEHDTRTEPDCVVVGINNETECADPVRDVPVERVIVHSGYVPRTLKNDIALIRLKTTLPDDTMYVSPICLPFGIKDTGAELRKYSVSGWGKMGASRINPASPVLQFAYVSGIPPQQCNEQQPDPKNRIDQSQLCADDSKGADACKGDSGGPLMIIQKLPSRVTSQAFLIGIVSYGLRNCDEQFAPTAYTRVHYYLDWILDNIAK